MAYGNKQPVQSADMGQMDESEAMMPADHGIMDKGGMGDEDCVPLNTLSSPGENDEMTNPSVGDLVQYQKEGKVTRIEGDNAYVKVNSVNGKPLTAEDAKTKDTPGQENEAEFASLKEAAQERMM